MIEEKLRQLRLNTLAILAWATAQKACSLATAVLWDEEKALTKALNAKLADEGKPKKLGWFSKRTQVADARKRVLQARTVRKAWVRADDAVRCAVLELPERTP